jgi:hypothetical protein
MFDSAICHQAESGHRSVILTTDRTHEGLLHFDTCRKVDSGSSANPAIGQSFGIGPQTDGKLPFSG